MHALKPVGWVEPFAKPIIFADQIDGYRSAPPILRAGGLRFANPPYGLTTSLFCGLIDPASDIAMAMV
jgi:hypothetical protein